MSPEGGFELSNAWSRSRPVRETEAGRAGTLVRVRPDYMGLFAEAARIFRETAPQEDVRVTGSVVRLERRGREMGGGGLVTLSALVEDRPRQVLVELLSDEAYREAILAHQHRWLVGCTGDLTREGKWWRLRSAREFAVLGGGERMVGGVGDEG